MHYLSIETINQNQRQMQEQLARTLSNDVHRLSPQSQSNTCLAAYNTTTTKVGEVQTSVWSGENSEEWVFTLKEDKSFRISPRSAWARVLSGYEKTNHCLERNFY